MDAYTYYEPNKFPAMLLALLVHGLFFGFLFFGFNWHVRSSSHVEVEMWASLPSIKTESPAPQPHEPPPPAPQPQVAPQPPKAAAPELPHKADIEFKEKKKKQERLKQEEEAKAQLEAQKIAEKQKIMAQERQEAARVAMENTRIQALKAQMQAEMDADRQAQVSRYKDMIQAKIRRNIVMPPDVPENAEAQFFVIVLPGGDVVSVTLKKSSGNAAYDAAAERAIYKAQPLPMPQDSDLARMFRELRLSLKP